MFEDGPAGNETVPVTVRLPLIRVFWLTDGVPTVKPARVADAISSVENAPVFLTVDPIGGGEAQVDPRRREELRFGTTVVDVTEMVVKFPVALS